MQEGESYIVVLTNGFVFVGNYSKPSGINDAIFTDAHFVTRCGEQTDWGQFIRNGPQRGFVVNQTGDSETTINLDFRLWSCPFPHMKKVIGKTR